MSNRLNHLPEVSAFVAPAQAGELKDMCASLYSNILFKRSNWNGTEFWEDVLSIFAEQLSKEYT